MAGHELAHGRKPVAGGCRSDSRAQVVDDTCLCVIMNHEYRR